MRKILVVLGAFALTACGSLNTVVNSDQNVSASLKNKNTYCDSIPRVYSGVAYDFCCLHSNPGGTYVDGFLGFYLMDVVASTVVDTAILPYTGYLQYKYGRLVIQ